MSHDSQQRKDDAFCWRRRNGAEGNDRDTVSELNMTSRCKVSQEDDTEESKVDKKQPSTQSSDKHWNKTISLKGEDLLALGSQQLHTVKNDRDSEQRHLDDTLFEIGMSSPNNRVSQEIDYSNTPLFQAARKTAELIGSDTILPPGMLTSHDAWYLTLFHGFSDDTVQEMSIESQLHSTVNLGIAAAAEERLLSSEAPKNDVDEYYDTSSVDDATQMTPSSQT